jgi:SAM-dependent methyltransferase
MSDPENFYTGLVAELYEPLAGGISDSNRFIKFVEKHGEPALEICCGTGLPLLDLLEAGLDVEGLDASQDMLEICEEKASERGLRVTLHHAKMQDFQLLRRFRSAYIANGSITLLPSDDALRQTLRTIIECLDPVGVVLFDLDVPKVDVLRRNIGKFRETQYEGCRIRVGMTRVDWHEKDSELIIKLRYERVSLTGEVESVDRDWFRKVWSVDRFCELLVDSGFYIGEVEDLDNGITQVCAGVAT